MFSLMFTLLLAASSTETAGTPPADTTTETPAKEKLVCRRIMASNSRLPKKECRTQQEWDQAADKNGEKSENYRRSQ